MKLFPALLFAGFGLGMVGIVWSADVEAQAQGRGRFAQPAPSPGETAFKAECGSCHMPFPSYMLPARSWVALMEGLSKHFKENASLDADTKKLIESYLVANAGDAPGQNSRFVQGLDARETPLRVTETPNWQRRHRRVTEATLARRNVKSTANCQGCHEGALQGNFDDS